MSEPLTALTDYALALESGLFAVWLLGYGWPQRCWAAAFFCVGVGAVLGGTFHGFGPELSHSRQVDLWQGVVLALAAASFWLIAAVAWEVRSPWRWGLLTLGAIKLAASVLGGAAAWGFALRVGDYLISLVLVLGVWMWPPSRPGAAWLGAGLGLSALAAATLGLPHGPGISPAAIYHLIQMGGLYCFYRAIVMDSEVL